MARHRRRRRSLSGAKRTCTFGVNKNTGACLKKRRAKKRRR